MPARKGWDQLSPAYRQRLERAGIARADYATADLRKARGHGFRAPASAAPETAREAIGAGTSTAATRRQLEAWRKSARFPSWLPRDRADLDDASVAILSTIKPAPNARGNGWEKVIFDWGQDPNAPVTLTITPKRGYAFQVDLPNHDAARSFLSWMRRSGKFPGASIDHKSHGRMSNARNAEPGPRPAAPAGKAAPKKKAAAKKTPPKSVPAKKSPAKKTKRPAKKAAAPLQPLANLADLPGDLVDDLLYLIGGPDTTDPIELLRRAVERLQELT